MSSRGSENDSAGEGVRRIIQVHRPTGAPRPAPPSLPPPPTPSSPPPFTAGDGRDAAAESYRQEIVSIYQQHNPGKLQDLPRIFSLNVGKEAQLLNDVRAKYSSMGTPSMGSPAEVQLQPLSPQSRPAQSSPYYGSPNKDPYMTDNPMMRGSTYQPDRAGGEESKMEAFEIWDLRNASIPNLPSPLPPPRWCRGLLQLGQPGKSSRSR